MDQGPSPTPLETLSNVYSGLLPPAAAAAAAPDDVTAPQPPLPAPPRRGRPPNKPDASGNSRSSRKRTKRQDEDDDDDAGDSPPPATLSGTGSDRFKWTLHLHQLFLASIFEIGLAAASPKKIYEQMRSDPQLAKSLLGDEMASRLLESSGEGSTTGAIGPQHVKSHLQRYRQNVKDGRRAFILQAQDLMEQSRNVAAAHAYSGGTKPINPEYHAYPFAADRAFPDAIGLTIVPPIDVTAPSTADGTDGALTDHMSEQMRKQVSMRAQIENQGLRQMVTANRDRLYSVGSAPMEDAGARVAAEVNVDGLPPWDVENDNLMEFIGLDFE